MPFAAPPRLAAWQHDDGRAGFEVVFVSRTDDGYRFDGVTNAVEDAEAWTVQYLIDVASDWTTRSARVMGRSTAGLHGVSVEAAGSGRWRVNGAVAPDLDGCLDLDLESSALTNAFPVRRLGLGLGQRAEAPAAYVRALDLAVERLEQRYVRLDGDRSGHRYRYAAPRFEFECEIVYDRFGLVLDYPGIAVRVR